VLEKYTSITARMETFTTSIRTDGTGVFYLPSLTTFERITPRSTPTGMVFLFTTSMLLIGVMALIIFHTPDHDIIQMAKNLYGFLIRSR